METELIITGSNESLTRLWDSLRHLRDANQDFGRKPLVISSYPVNGHISVGDTQARAITVDLDAYPYGRDIFAALAFASGVQIWKPLVAGLTSL